MLNRMEKKKKRINHISFWRFFRENVFLYCFKNYKSHAQNDFYFYFEVLVTPKYFGRIIYQLHCNVFSASSCFTMSNIKFRCIQTCIFRVICMKHKLLFWIGIKFSIIPQKIFSPKESAKISLYSGQATFYFNPGQCVIYSLIISLAPFIDPKGGFLRIFSSWKRTCGHVAKRRVSQKLLQIILSQLHVLPSRRIKCNKSKCNKIIKLKRTMSNWVKHAVNDVVYTIWNEDDL